MNKKSFYHHDYFIKEHCEWLYFSEDESSDLFYCLFIPRDFIPNEKFPIKWGIHDRKSTKSLKKEWIKEINNTTIWDLPGWFKELYQMANVFYYKQMRLIFLVYDYHISIFNILLYVSLSHHDGKSCYECGENDFIFPISFRDFVDDFTYSLIEHNYGYKRVEKDSVITLQRIRSF